MAHMHQEGQKHLMRPWMVGPVKFLSTYYDRKKDPAAKDSRLDKGMNLPIIRNPTPKSHITFHGPTTQAKRKSKHRSLLQQVGPHHETYDMTVRQALSSRLETHP
eukprot:1160232-Pelagomonas_calceolata.AAC.9